MAELADVASRFDALDHASSIHQTLDLVGTYNEPTVVEDLDQDPSGHGGVVDPGPIGVGEAFELG